MATNFPASLDSLSNPSPNNTLDSPSHSTHHANLNDAIEALEAKVGVDGSAVATSHDKILTLKANLASPTFTGTVTAPTFSGSGASLTSIPNSATTATSGNTASAIVARDASGDFSARVIVATTYAGAGRGVGIAGGPSDTPAILQFLNNAGNAQWSSLVATNNLLTVTTPLAATVTTAAQPNITSATTGTFTAGTFSGSGAGLTNIPGDKLLGGQTVSNTQQYTFGATETYWVNTYSAGNVQINLPNAASYPGRILHIRNSVGGVHIYSHTNNVAYVTAAQTANNDWFGASYVLHQGDGFWCQLLSNGSIWVTTMTSEI